eukprot:6368123-Prymnesium_polylepis.1
MGCSRQSLLGGSAAGAAAANLASGRVAFQVSIRQPCRSARHDERGAGAHALFSLELATAVAAIPGASPFATAAATTTTTTPATTSAAAASTAPARRQTKQVLAAADLRAKLKQVVELQRSHKAGSSKQAEAILAELRAEPGKAPSIHTAYKQSEQLRDVALGFGGYAQAKLVIQQFIKMPLVQLVLPDALRELQLSSSDSSAALELMGHAKQFFTETFGVGFRGGRLSDEDRNAFAASSACILPRDLFAKRGRAAAASRLTGLSYRQMHRGSDQRRELEDRAGGWRRIRTAEHRDKIDWGPLKEAWHSDLLSTEDNQNKDMVSPQHTPLLGLSIVLNPLRPWQIRVFLGTDPTTGEQLYDIHPRRATICSLRAAVKIAREKNLVPGAVVGRRQLGDAKCACIKERKASQCDCEQCTQVTLSLGRFNKSRAGWHTAYRSTNGGKGCTCPLHDCSSEAAAAATAEAAAAQATAEAAARRADAEVWAAHAPDSQAAARSATEANTAEAAAAAAKSAATAAAAKLAGARLRIQRYAAMSASEEALLAALLPCGRREFEEETVTGEKTFKCYPRACSEGNCPNRGSLFERRKGSACGYDLVFEGHRCPVDNSDDEFIWLRWEKMLRNENKDRETDDGKQAKPSYSMELVPHRGTRREFMAETFHSGGKVSFWMPHVRRVRWCRQARRLIDDHKRGLRVAPALSLIHISEPTRRS